jgi:succinate dehydrogenase / fumarate reductase membrane anchor subunit
MRETKYWTWHMAAGVAIFVLLGLHMTTMHLGGLTHLSVANPAEEAISPANSQARDARVIFEVMYVALLGIALYHGFYGLRTVIFELTLKPAMEKAVTTFLVIAGVGLFVFGTWVAVAAHLAAKTAGFIGG